MPGPNSRRPTLGESESGVSFELGEGCCGLESKLYLQLIIAHDSHSVYPLDAMLSHMRHELSLMPLDFSILPPKAWVDLTTESGKF